MVICSNGFFWCFPHSLDHDPNLWHLFPDSLAVAVVRLMCKSFDSRKLPVPSRWGGKKWELTLGPSSLAIVTAEPVSKNYVDGWIELFYYFMRRIRVFPFSGETVQMQTAFYSVTMQWESLIPCKFSAPHHNHASSCLCEDHYWDTDRNSGNELGRTFPGTEWGVEACPCPPHTCLHTLGHASGIILLYHGMLPIRGAAGCWQQKNLCFSHSLMSYDIESPQEIQLL